jgi:hypothetical protein
MFYISYLCFLGPLVAYSKKLNFQKRCILIVILPPILTVNTCQYMDSDRTSRIAQELANSSFVRKNCQQSRVECHRSIGKVVGIFYWWGS